MTSAMRRAYQIVAERDSGWSPVPLCLVCKREADDVAHILPRGRHPELKAEVCNLASLCRSCHIEHETYGGRVKLLRLMHRKYGYDYNKEPYRGYWHDQS